MGCNCGASKAKPMTYEVVVNGKKRIYRTEMEAKAALVRAKETGTVTAVPKS